MDNMDDTLRRLEREGALDPAAREHFERSARRLGRHALLYLGPDPVPQRIVAPPRRDSCPRVHNEKLCVARHRTLCASGADAMERSIEKRNRRAARHACDEGLLEYYEG
jgi:hypothetical protein